MNAISAVAEFNGRAPMARPSREMSWATDRRPVDHAAVERAAHDLLAALGADLETEGLRETPRRMAAACVELLTPEPFSLTTFPNDEGYDELVVVRDIAFESLCMHHMLPFHGVAHVAYLPAELQERLTTQIAGCLQERLQPKGVGVVAEAEHLCMSSAACRNTAPRPLPRRYTDSYATTRGHAASSSA
jgi:GTP cyclohydrolase IA